jgi:hypothetical protein
MSIVESCFTVSSLRYAQTLSLPNVSNPALISFPLIGVLPTYAGVGIGVVDPDGELTIAPALVGVTLRMI